jgi:hypothetical protein
MDDLYSVISLGAVSSYDSVIVVVLLYSPLSQRSNNNY